MAAAMPTLCAMRPGDVVAMWSRTHSRFVTMNGDPTNMGGVSVSPHANQEELSEQNWPCCWFHVVEGGNGTIALWNAEHCRYVRMINDPENYQVNVDVSERKGLHELPSEWNSERFRVVDGGEGETMLWSPTHKRCVRMNGDPVNLGGMDASDAIQCSKVLPPASEWPWERFVILRQDRGSLKVEELIIHGAGCSKVNGVYKKVGSFGSQPMWQQVGGSDFQLWFNSSHGRGLEWRIGFTDDYYYVNNARSPFQGVWLAATGRCSNSNAATPAPIVMTESAFSRQKPVGMASQGAPTPSFDEAMQMLAGFPFKIYNEGDYRIAKILCPGVAEECITIQITHNGAVVSVQREDSVTRVRLDISCDDDDIFKFVSRRSRMESGFLYIYFQRCAPEIFTMPSQTQCFDLDSANTLPQSDRSVSEGSSSMFEKVEGQRRQPDSSEFAQV